MRGSSQRTKRRIGYQELDLREFCGNCGNCIRRGGHLRCSAHGIAVSMLGICRAGWTEASAVAGADSAMSMFRKDDLPLLDYRPEEVANDQA